MTDDIKIDPKELLTPSLPAQTIEMVITDDTVLVVSSLKIRVWLFNDQLSDINMSKNNASAFSSQSDRIFSIDLETGNRTQVSGPNVETGPLFTNIIEILAY